MTTDLEALELARVVAQIADDEHGVDVLVLEVGDVLAITEYFVLVSASNRRLVRALVDEIEKQSREATGRSPRWVEGGSEHQWVLIDYGDVVVHVFLVGDPPVLRDRAPLPRRAEHRLANLIRCRDADVIGIVRCPHSGL